VCSELLREKRLGFAVTRKDFEKDSNDILPRKIDIKDHRRCDCYMTSLLEFIVRFLVYLLMEWL